MSDLSISTDLVAELTRDVAGHGALECETGGFLLAQREKSGEAGHLDVLALARNSGIQRRRDLFVISATAIERLFTWAGEQELAIRAQVHSHRKQAFLSPTDERHGFAVERFITTVIPSYATPPIHPAQWGWWRYVGTRWTPTESPSVTRGTVVTVDFDEDGVLER